MTTESTAKAATQHAGLDLSTESMKRIIRAAMFTRGVKGRWGLPILIEGGPGGAKTSFLELVAAESALHCEVVVGSLREPSDILGLPIPREQGGDTIVEYAAPSWARRLAKAGRGIGLFDEINTSAPAVQAALLRCILDGVVGDFPLPNTIRWMAAQNATEEAAGGWDLAAPLANRFGHLKWPKLSAEEWNDWMLGAGGAGEAAGPLMDAEREEQRVEAEWDAAYASARGIVTAFIRARPEHLSAQPPAGSPQASKAWPSPRTWEMATRAMAGAKIHALSESETEEFIGAFVGPGPASELVEFMEKTDLPDPVKVLDGEVEFKPDDRLDRTVAVLSSCAALCTPPSATKRKERGAALWLIMRPIAEETPDLCVGPAKSMVRAKLHVLLPKESQKPLALLQDVMDAAGML